MKKILPIFGTIVVLFIAVGFVGFLLTEQRAESQSTAFELTPIETTTKDPLERFQISHTEFSSLENYVIRVLDDITYDNIEELILANSILHYVNYYEEDIAERGMTEEFKALQRKAYDVWNLHTKVGDDSEEFLSLANELKAMFRDIADKF